ncbi:hypothetical protein [Nitrosomonas aestuarii]|uniref:hypothetical protein n=1 Tax=Nitrosomonas aestuarii TaxID=52441 RepID=UPI000D3F70D2|nr:hypothetical protein [Nitrosomonas aestuarii]PTN11841.1 hypothetical protein C8R11_107126 [Nitrosomonas aestuarii]
MLTQFPLLLSEYFTVARFELLPIYKQAMGVAVHFEKVVAGSSRYHKYRLGIKLRNKSREIVVLIVKAKNEKGSYPIKYMHACVIL